MISLSAEQKSIEGMYCTTTEQYIVPHYQRPYSWTFDQCGELLRDLLNAFSRHDSYFLGNVILARGKEFDMNGQNFIVDGQQRIITLWTLIKVLSLLLDDVSTLQSALSVTPWQGDCNEPKIKSQIFENNDDKAIRDVFGYDLDTVKERYAALTAKGKSLKEEKCHSMIEAALLYFYQQITNAPMLADRLNLMRFAQFLMKRVSMLPIVQTGDSDEEAKDKALTIFETINNRGLDLVDADIFKARLYDSAPKAEKEAFISLWVDFKAECDRLKVSVDDVFRYYSHVIRGREGITSSEKRLRDFFTNEPFSPLTYSTYDVVLGDLNKILGILKYIRETAGTGAPNQPGPWLQIINEYTNQYPVYAVVVYLYNYPIENQADPKPFVDFLQSLVRFCLYTGSTTSVKFGIYPIIKAISHHVNIPPYRILGITAEQFNHLGYLKNAFALLCYLLDTDCPIPKKYSIDKIVNLRDESQLPSTWPIDRLNELCNSIGNLVVLDIPKRYNSLKEKKAYYAQSKSSYVNSIFKNGGFCYSDLKERTRHMQSLLLDFFKA